MDACNLVSCIKRDSYKDEVIKMRPRFTDGINKNILIVRLVMFELTVVPFEENINLAHECSLEKYKDLWVQMYKKRSNDQYNLFHRYMWFYEPMSVWIYNSCNMMENEQNIVVWRATIWMSNPRVSL